ncbi:MAG: hypothetical protein ACM65M_01170 [Microcoleus sp.]
MVNSNRAEDIASENERSLSTLLRTIARFQGKFSLTLACCNYASLRYAMLQKLRVSAALVEDRSTVAYQELVLTPATKILHQTILDAVQEQPPKALIIVGIESVVALDDLLAGANRARDQFKQDFAFPVILWVTDAVLAKFSRSATDLKSWAPSPIQFTIPPDDLMIFLQQQADQAFANVENFKLEECEIESLENDLKNLRETLDPELQASWQFIRGLVQSHKNKIDLAIAHYQQSLAFWQQNHQLERQGIVGQKIAEAYNRKAELQRAGKQDYWQEARNYLQQSLDIFEQAQRNDLAAKCISELGEVLRLLQAWEELQNLAEKALKIHEICGTPSQVAQDYGFLAEVALQKSQWEKAGELAELALAILSQPGVSQLGLTHGDSETGFFNKNTSLLSPDSVKNPVSLVGVRKLCQQETGLYLLLLAKAQRNLSQQSEAVNNLQAAKEITQPQDDVQLYLRILEELRTLYFEQGKYLKAFHIKLEQQQVKSKYGLQAFIGASRLQSPQQIIDIGLASGKSKAEIIEEIEAASGRSRDIKEISKRIRTPGGRLTIVYGQSGVGKSSIIQAWLVPALQLTTLEARDILPVLLQSYHDWARDCGQCLKAGIEQLKGVSLSGAIDTPTAILEQLRLNQDRNLLTVLIFDQFEEFFFAYQDRIGRRELYDFLAECLNQISDLKIILSLREDYLFYLLEFNRATNLSIIDNDILTKIICYYLGNFSISDATTVVQTLTKGSQFYWDEDLVDAMIADLAGTLGEVRPIELQIVGMQLEKQHITRLTEYQQLGSQAKVKLVKEFLDEVIRDCGRENKDIAELVLYLLTDENNTRPQKTWAELAADSGSELETLDLVIEIVVKSGLVLEVPATPKRYQLVHDYLVPFIRNRKSVPLLKLHEINQDLAKMKRSIDARQQARNLSQERRDKLENAMQQEQKWSEELRDKSEKLVDESEKLLAMAEQKAKLMIIGITIIFSISLIGAIIIMGVAWQQLNKP